MKTAYPIIISKGKEYYVVDVPDFDINTEGKDIADAMEMARDAIAVTGCYLEDEGKSLPPPSKLASIDRQGDDVVTLVDVDFAAYRRKNDQRTIRKNVTIPSWLNYEAERQHINVSRVLTEALTARVGGRV